MSTDGGGHDDHGIRNWGARRARRIDGDKPAEFIHGTVTGMAAVVGIEAGHGVPWLRAESISRDGLHLPPFEQQGELLIPTHGF